MTELPPITIIIITYNRPQEIRKTMRALLEHVLYSGKVHWLIADDSTPGDYAAKIGEWAKKHISKNVTISQTSTNSGWGANANLAMSRADTEFIFFTEDDYILTQDINIDPYISLILKHEGVGLVRLDGIAGHRAVAHASQTNISEYMANYRQAMSNIGQFFYWLLDHSSRETWLYSNRPHIKHKRFHRFYGLYPEGLPLGKTEESFAHTVKDSMPEPGAQAIAVPMELSLPVFDHIGISFQHTEHDKETN